MSANGSESVFGSPFEFGTGSDSDFIFNTFNEELQQVQSGLSVNSDVGRGSLDSSVMDYSPASDFETLLNDANLNTPFDFGPQNINNPWPAPEGFFTTYNVNAQQPTPAMSDFDYNKDSMVGATNDIDMQEFLNTENAGTYEQPDMTLYSPPTDMFPQHASPAMPQLHGGDFALFGEQTTHGEMDQAFPDLGNVGDQFPNTAGQSFATIQSPMEDFSFDQM